MPKGRPALEPGDPCMSCESTATYLDDDGIPRCQSCNEPQKFVKCQVCDAGMQAKHAAAHIQLHIVAGDLIRLASRREQVELENEASGDR